MRTKVTGRHALVKPHASTAVAVPFRAGETLKVPWLGGGGGGYHIILSVDVWGKKTLGIGIGGALNKMISFDYGTSRGAMCDSDQLTVLLRVAVIIIHVLALFRGRQMAFCE